MVFRLGRVPEPAPAPPERASYPKVAAPEAPSATPGGTAGFGFGALIWIKLTAALVDDGHEGEVYTPTGPEAISLAEIADVLSDVTGREIRFQHLSDDQWVAAMLAAGRHEVDARATLALISKTRDGHATLVTDDVERVTGKKPRSFAQFARDHAEVLTAFADAPAPAGPPARG